ncbi:hypothetical protein [Calothrix sp. NIES-3974]|uniref:hypothetical protein n=1 Tax=Calothrix sp. NIES-3974 TaxID=2005462 RepID=UPI000BBC3417|nr:hypothetical protein [Calothrix sp. NIES-3974]
MRSWQFWIRGIILSSQSNPPRFIELLMLGIAIAMLVLSTIFPQEHAYMVLGLSLVVGASLSILVREAIAPSHQSRVTKITALLLLVISFYGYLDLIHHI